MRTADYIAWLVKRIDRLEEAYIDADAAHRPAIKSRRDEAFTIFQQAQELLQGEHPYHDATGEDARLAAIDAALERFRDELKIVETDQLIAEDLAGPFPLLRTTEQHQHHVAAVCEQNPMLTPLLDEAEVLTRAMKLLVAAAIRQAHLIAECNPDRDESIQLLIKRTSALTRVVARALRLP